jgi:hypothetical protein
VATRGSNHRGIGGLAFNTGTLDHFTSVIVDTERSAKTGNNSEFHSLHIGSNLPNNNARAEPCGYAHQRALVTLAEALGVSFLVKKTAGFFTETHVVDC